MTHEYPDARFLTDFTTVKILRDKPGCFEVSSPVIFYSKKFNMTITVMPGYPTDFASIPQFLKDRVDVNGKHREAAIVHDYLCTNGEEVGVTQKIADLIFEEAMQVLGVNPITRWLMFNSVRAFQKFKSWRNGVSYG